MFFKLKYCSNDNWFNYDQDEIFHFTKLASFEQIMNSTALRFRKNNYSNDDRDGKICDYLFSAIESLYSTHFSDNSQWVGFSAMIKSFFELYEHLNLKRRSNDYSLNIPTMYNLCFSTEINSELWSEYGDSDRGVVIEFSKSWLKRFLDYPNDTYNDNKYFDCTCGKVIYDDESKNFIIRDILINGFKDYCTLETQEQLNDCLLEVETQLLICSYFF